jgi:hypothetical protein
VREINIGDVVEIKKSKGLVYAQYTHKHPVFGALIRVFKGAYDDRVNDLEGVVMSELAFECFFPLGAAVNKGLVSIVGGRAYRPLRNHFQYFGMEWRIL